MSTTTGTIVRVRRDPAGDGLAADAAIGATSLVLGWAIDFDPEGGTLQVGAEVIAYTAVDDDTDTVTLAAATTVAYEAGEPVAELDELGVQAETWTVDVSLADSGQTVPAVPVHSLLSMLREGDAMAGMRVEVETTDEGNVIRSIDGKGAAVESDLVMRGGKILSQTDDGVTTTAIGPIGTELGFPTSTYAGLLVKTALGNGMLEAFARVDTPTDGGLVYVGDPFSSIQPRANFNVRDFSLTAGTGSGGFSTDGIQLVNSLTNSQIHIAAGFGIFCSTGSDHMFTITDDTGNAGLGFTANAANMNISTVDGSVCRVTSSRRYKQNIKPARIDVQAVLALQPKQFRTKAEVKKFGKDAPVHVGVIAEEAADLGLDAWVEHDKDGPEAFAYANFSVALLAVVQDQQRQIGALEKRLAKLESGDR